MKEFMVICETDTIYVIADGFNSDEGILTFFIRRETVAVFVKWHGFKIYKDLSSKKVKKDT